MENREFDQLARGLATGASRRRILGGLAAALLGGTALATGGDAKKRAKAQKADKVLICHKPGTADQETKEVPESALKAHLAHGDTPGACPTPPPCGTDFCEQDETCIGGGGAQFPQVCCPNNRVCGGPGASVQICCQAGTRCQGEIPNQQCVAVTTTTTRPPIPCGTDFCEQDETCIGGGGAQFPQVCCPNNRVCGGPGASVQICCQAGTRCQGNIPNQQCVAVTTTTTQQVTTTTPQAGICSGNCNTNNANQCSNRGGAFCFCQPQNGISGPGVCITTGGGGGGGGCLQPLGGCNNNNALCTAGCVCQGNTCVAGGTGGSNCAACNNQTCRTGVLGDCNAACTCQAVSTGTTSAPGAFNGICVPGPICLTTTTARPGTTTPPVTPPPGQLTECGPGTANPCENGCCAMNTSGFFTCEDGGAKGACGKGGTVCKKCGGRKKCSVNKGVCRKIKTKGA